MATGIAAPKEYRAGAGRKLSVLVACTLLLMINFMDRQVAGEK